MFGFNLRLIAAGVAACVVASAASYGLGRWHGASSARLTAEIAAARATAERLKLMGKNDAELRAMPQADLCRELARAGGLPATACD